MRPHFVAVAATLPIWNNHVEAPECHQCRCSFGSSRSLCSYSLKETRGLRSNWGGSVLACGFDMSQSCCERMIGVMRQVFDVEGLQRRIHFVIHEAPRQFRLHKY
jgi:hypothetical protein